MSEISGGDNGLENPSILSKKDYFADLLVSQEIVPKGSRITRIKQVSKAGSSERLSILPLVNYLDLGNPDLDVYSVKVKSDKVKSRYAVKLGEPGLKEKFGQVYQILDHYFRNSDLPGLLPDQWENESVDWRGKEVTTIIQSWVEGKPLDGLKAKDFRKFPDLAGQLERFLQAQKQLWRDKSKKIDYFGTGNIIIRPDGNMAFIGTDFLISEGAWKEYYKILNKRHSVILLMIMAAEEGKPISYGKAYNKWLDLKVKDRRSR